MLKWVNNKRITVVNQDKLLTNAKKLTKYEVQNFIYLLDKGDPTVKAPYGLTTEEAKRLIALIKNIALLQKNK